MSNTKDYKCVLDVKNKEDPCQQKECRHWIKCGGDLNCSIIASEEGPKTLQQIGDYYGISRMRICQIEKSLLEKLRNSNLLKEFGPYDSLS